MLLCFYIPQETRWRKRKGNHQSWPVYKGGFGDDGSHTIQQFELTVRNISDRYVQWTPSDTDVRVFSNANGIKVAHSSRAPLEEVSRSIIGESDYERLKLLKRDGLQFGGIASNRASPSPPPSPVS